MDTLHSVLRSIRPKPMNETKSRRDHLDVFREFLDHLDRAARRRGVEKPAKAPRPRPSAASASPFRHRQFVRTASLSKRGGRRKTHARTSRTHRRLRVCARTTIDADGTVEGYASLFGELARRRTVGSA